MDEDGRNAVPRVKLRSFSNSLPVSLLQAREAVMNRFRPALRLFNITEQQWRVLRALSSVEAIEVTALANATCLLPPSLSRILKDMEDRGLLVKRPVPQDLRRTLVSITPNGMRVIDAVAPYSEEIYSEITDSFGPDRMEMLQGLLRELAASMEELPARTYDAGTLDCEIVEIISGQQRGRPRGVSVAEPVAGE